MRRLCVILLGLLAVSGLLACDRYGKKLTFKKGEVYYKPPVTKAEAYKLGNLLVKRGYFDNTRPKSVQILKVGSTYQVRFVVKKAILGKPRLINSLEAMGALASGEVFNNAAVEVHLCDEKLKTYKTLGPIVGHGNRVELNKGEVFYQKPVTQAEAEKLAQILKKLGYFKGQPRSVQIRRRGDVTQLRVVIKPGVEKNPEMIASYRLFGTWIKRDLPAKGAVEVHLCDEAFKTLKIVQ
jgi:hypothetical protein